MGCVDIPIDVLEQLRSTDLEEYLDWLREYEFNGVRRTNTEGGIKRKLCSLRSLYTYLFNHDLIETNPTKKIDVPRIPEKEIVLLEKEEIVKFLDEVEYGEHLAGRLKAIHEKTKIRDLAITTLLLATGIRVSELVGLNITDINFQLRKIRVRRKGGSEESVYFNREALHALNDYWQERNRKFGISHEDKALFLQSTGKRLSVRSVESLVEKYARFAFGEDFNKKICPHRLRATYGTHLYDASGDLFLTSEILGHKDCNTTRKYYVRQSDLRKRMAADLVLLRE